MPGWIRALSQKKKKGLVPSTHTRGLTSKQNSNFTESDDLFWLARTFGCILYTRTHEGTNVPARTHKHIL